MSQAPLFPRNWTRQPPALAADYKTSITRSPRLPLLSLDQTPSELNGPTFAPSDIGQLDSDLIQNYAKDGPPIGERVLLYGKVIDENARPLPYTLVEIWQANASGRYRHVKDGYLAALDPNFGGCGRTLTDAQGRYSFKTIKPGAYPLSFLGGSGWRCRHIHFKVSCPGYRALTTQMYFEGDPLIAQDFEIAKAPEESRHLLIAAATPDEGSGLLLYRFDIVLAPLA